LLPGRAAFNFKFNFEFNFKAKGGFAASFAG